MGYPTIFVWAIISSFFLFNPARAEYLLPDTGQTKCYGNVGEISCPLPNAPFYGQDAQFVRNLMSFTDHGNGTVTDNNTGLMWEVKSNNPTAINYAGNTYNWYETVGLYDSLHNPNNVSYTRSLNAASFGGHDDWRIPSLEELVTIADYGTHDPAINTNYFQNIQYGWESLYWSSNFGSIEYYPDDAWTIAFDVGNTPIRHKNQAYYVIAVRGGQSVNNFIDNGDGTVSDTVTGLMWQKDDGGLRPQWQQSLANCEGMTLAGFLDWRLPNIKELASILDLNIQNPAIGPYMNPVFKGNEAAYFSSTTANDNTASYTPEDSWAVNFDSGYVTTSGKTAVNFVRCVRGGKNPVRETISTPTTPSGPASGVTGTSYSYSTGGSTSNLGNPVEYQFDWRGDGSDVSLWGSPTQSKGWATAGTYVVRAMARSTVNTPVVSNWSGTLSVTITAPEIVSPPTTPSAPTSGIIAKSYKYTTGGSASSLGNPVEYQFDWKGDGSDLSNWGSAGQSKTWTTGGVYSVRARARSAPNISVMSGWSNPLSVSICVPKILVSPTTYNFGNVKVKRSKTISLKVTNSGMVNLLISASLTGTDASIFKITSGSGNKTIKPGKSLSITVAFKPTSTGPKTSTLEITSNDPITSTVDIPLSGIGQ